MSIPISNVGVAAKTFGASGVSPDFESAFDLFPLLAAQQSGVFRGNDATDPSGSVERAVEVGLRNL